MTIEERLEKLERDLSCAKRRRRWLVAGAGLLLAAWVVSWAFEPGTAIAEPAKAGAVVREVRAKRFVLEDENGKRRAVLGVNKRSVMLILLGEKGQVLANLLATKTGASLWLSDEKGEERAVLSAAKDASHLVLLDEKGKQRATLRADKTSGSRLEFLDKNGKLLWSAPTRR